MKPALVVIGSLNMDFVVTVENLPIPGETVLGSKFQMIPGGKGANQACAAAKTGAGSVKVKMIGRVGNDVFADHLKNSLSAAGVDVSTVLSTDSEPTGIAMIWVDHKGQNSIVVASGANHALPCTEVQAMRSTIRGAKAVLFQLETPLDTVAAALELARSEGATTILDPAPAQLLSREILQRVDILTPNESEACILLGRSRDRLLVADCGELARALIALGPRAVILKLGDQGCFYSDGKTELHEPGFAVEAIDTTAAGDTFNAALAVALAEHRRIPEALRFANAAAAISVTRMGAQSSAPDRSEVEALLARG
jgi:ribokinase